MNLSYCRFQNTLIDFRDCVKAVEEDAELSDAETSAMLDLVTLAAKLVRIMTPKHYTTRSPDGAAQVIDPESRTITELTNALAAAVDALDRNTSPFPLPIESTFAVLDTARSVLAKARA